METKIKDITGAEITVTDLKEAVRQCRECLASPYLMPSGHTVGENHAYMVPNELPKICRGLEESAASIRFRAMICSNSKVSPFGTDAER